MIFTDFNNRVRYKLFNKDIGSKIIVDPIGWYDDSKEFARNETYFGIVSQFSNNLTFVKNGADYINFVYDTFGINAEIILTREELDPQTDVWTVIYTGYLDLSTWNFENKRITIKFNSGGLEKLLKSRESEQVEIDRIKSIDGLDILGINEIQTVIKGQSLPVVSSWKSAPDTPDNNAYVHEESDVGAFGSMSCGIPFATTENPLTEAESILYGSFLKQRDVGAGVTTGLIGQMFYNNSTKDRKLHIEINVGGVIRVQHKYCSRASFRILLIVFGNGTAYDVIEKHELYNVPNNSILFGMDGQTIAAQPFVLDKQLLTGQSLGLVTEVLYDLDRNAFGTKHARISVDLQQVTGSIFVSEGTTSTQTNSFAYLYYDLMQQLCRIVSGENDCFKSDYLKTALLGVTHGFYIRNFTKFPLTTGENVNQFKPLTTSFKDAFSSLDAVLPLGMGIETINNKETVVVEPIEYFFNPNVTIELPNQVSNLKRSVALEFYYSNLFFGSEADFTYEEVSGLDEFNTKTSYSTIISRVKKSYEKLAKYRFDGTGKELCRLQQASKDSTLDTKYDTNIWVLDLKLFEDGIRYEEKGWADYYAVRPEGIYSPDTSTGFYFAPKNCLFRHGGFINGGLSKNPNDYIYFAASEGNKQLSLNGIKTDDPVLNSDLDRPLFFPQWITFNYEVDFNILRTIQGSTTINGKQVKNFYGLVSFINENGNVEKGYLFNLKPDGAGEWKLLKM